ncbi:MAG: hypothetical protein AAGL17_20275 [Cyanobacteria bacterium J06576_12]
MKFIAAVVSALALGVGPALAESQDGESAGTSQQEGKVIRLQTAGNLAPSHDLPCITPDQLSAEYTPPDLMISAYRCASVGRLTDAVFLRAAMIVFGVYDSKRITDRTAAQGIRVLDIELGNALSRTAPGRLEQYQKELENILQNTGSLAGGACSTIVEVGPPDYHPAYLIAHGIGAPRDADGNRGPDLVSDFDPEATWIELADQLLGCPGVK